MKMIAPCDFISGLIRGEEMTVENSGLAEEFESVVDGGPAYVITFRFHGVI